MDNLKEALLSKKFWAAVIALVFVFVGERAGIDAAQLSDALNIVIAYIVGQGLADIRK